MSRQFAELDIENLVDFFQIKMKDRATGQIFNFPLYPDSPPLNQQLLNQLLAHYTIVTFNGNNYDLPILVLALYGATHQQLKEAGDKIILQRMKPWDFYNHYGIQIPEWIDHIDLFDVAPGVSIGLKMYMGRIHAPKMQDIPVAFDVPIRPEERLGISTYCDNDLEGTGLLREQLKDRLQLRAEMSARYKIDLRSKSDAQIAEAVIKASLSFKPERRYIQHGYSFKYEPPHYIRFATPELQQLLRDIVAADFIVSDKEEAIEMGFDDVTRTGVQIPESIKGRDIVVGRAKYRIGIGGLHSQESCVSYEADSNYLLDIDVKSYYPSLILGMGMTPEQLGQEFLDIYRTVYTRRLEAKAEASRLLDVVGPCQEALEAQTESDGLKIVLNGTFGKLFSKYSILYAPEFGIRTTITGQLALLMLIEMMELSGIDVISANTDGIVLNIPFGFVDIARSNVKWWERATGLEMEETEYSSIHMRDVNNYIAIGVGGKAKRKGVFAPGGLLSGPQGKHPDKDICADAVVAYLVHGTPIADTIHGCKDIRKFLQVRAVKKGAIDLPEGVAIDDGKYLGKAVRWYISGRPGHIGVVGTGDMVAGSNGATPIMTLPDYFPADVNHQYYINHAKEMLADIGVKYHE